jgi:flagellar hook-basal body complex protein FliE
MINNIDPNANSILTGANNTLQQTQGPGAGKAQFSQAVEALGEYVSQVDSAQKASEESIQDLLTGKNNDITAVVSSVAKADVSFKVLVGVRNQLIEAYKQTMNMQL